MTDALSATLSPLPAIPELSALWRDFDRCGQHSFFASWPWLGTWLELLPPGIAPLLVRIDERGRCCGGAILVRRAICRHAVWSSRELRLNETGDRELDCLTIEHNGFAGYAAADQRPWRAFVDWFGAEEGKADAVAIPGVCSELAPESLQPRFLKEERVLPAYRVDLMRLRAGGEIGAILSANARQQLNRSRRDLARSGPLVLEAAPSVTMAAEFFDGLERLHVRSWTRRGRSHAFTSPFFGRFHRALIRNHFATGGIELLRLRAGDRELGFLYNFRRNGCVYAYQSGFDDEDPRLRPGYVAHAMAIESHAAAGDMDYDFMAGRNRLKERFATDRYEMRWYQIQRPLLRFRVERAARAIKDLL